MGMLIAVIILGVVCLIMLIAALRRPPATAQRLESAMSQGGLVASGSALDESLHELAIERGGRTLLTKVHGWLEAAAPPQILANAEMTLERAGYNERSAVAMYLITRVVLAVAGVVGVVWVLFLFDGALLTRAALLLLVMAVTWIGPSAVISGIIRSRQEEIRYTLPDIIDLLAVSAEAGMGLDGALAVVIRRKPGPLSDEIDRMLVEIRLGAARKEAWNRMVRRVDIPELKAFVGALQDAEDMGVSIAETLRAQSDALRVKRSLIIRRLAATLPIKMLFPLIFCIMPALFAILLGPGLIAIFRAFARITP